MGYPRILDAVRKLGITKITFQTVKNILKEAGLDLVSKHGEGSWDDFLKHHADTQCVRPVFLAGGNSAISTQHPIARASIKTRLPPRRL